MPKLDKSKYTKQEYKALKLLGKNSKQVTQKYNIVCVKHGEKYPSDYANILYRMCKRNCTLDFTFTCLTDNPKGLDANINVVALPEGYTGWWAKPFMFSNDTGLTGTILYLDLDVVISNNIDKLFTYKPDRWCIIRDFLRAQRSTWQKYNSSVIRFNSGQLQAMYKDFDIHKQTILKRFRGDQDYIYDWAVKHMPAEFFPDKWILSYKWEIRSNKEWAPGGTVGNRTLKHIENVVPPKDCCIAVFHGDPNPSNCKDPFVVDNWQ